MKTPTNQRCSECGGVLRVRSIEYDVVEDPEAVVLVRAVGVKDRNAVRIGRKEILL